MSGKATAGEELHGDEVDAVIAGDVVNGDDVGMIQRRGQFCLLHKAPLAVSVRDFLRRQDFDGDEAIISRFRSGSMAGRIAETLIAELS
ncbi:MAG TPA: hypothetical protein VK335_04520 [Bryobacteraceae bacterium]|nr:hypothetical protein [Bryobacteraceae bacterium]HXR16947.1 hypothetical protein [Terriglobales bacterium]HZW96298.1 hypothetical protein [Candidatus Eremiobacteraceae bacterium]